MPTPRYVIQRTVDGYYWRGGDRWSFSVIGALWFASMTEANLRGLSGLPNDQRGSWAAVLTDWDR